MQMNILELKTINDGSAFQYLFNQWRDKEAQKIRLTKALEYNRFLEKFGFEPSSVIINNKITLFLHHDEDNCQKLDMDKFIQSLDKNKHPFLQEQIEAFTEEDIISLRQLEVRIDCFGGSYIKKHYSKKISEDLACKIAAVLKRVIENINNEIDEVFEEFNANSENMFIKSCEGFLFECHPDGRSADRVM